MARLPDRVGIDQQDLDAITRTALDYLEGFVLADPDRHLSSYHPEAVKRRFAQDQDGIFWVNAISPRTMADYAAVETPAETPHEIVIDAVYDDIASVRVYSNRWVDFLHIVKARGEWKLFHVTWQNRDITIE